MKPRYYLILLVAAASFGAPFVLPVREVVRELTVIPGIAALAGFVGMLLKDEFAHQRQLLRDELTHQRQQELQERSQASELGIASHMAERAFDKHVDFVEEYFAKLSMGLQKLSAEGAREYARQLADELRDVRRKYSPWLTSTIEDKLFPFEHHGLRTMGAKAGLLDQKGAVPVGPRRTQLVEEVTAALLVVLGLHDANDESKAMAASTILEHLRSILGIAELTTLRTRALQRALTATDEAPRK